MLVAASSETGGVRSGQRRRTSGSGPLGDLLDVGRPVAAVDHAAPLEVDRAGVPRRGHVLLGVAGGDDHPVRDRVVVAGVGTGRTGRAETCGRRGQQGESRVRRASRESSHHLSCVIDCQAVESLALLTISPMATLYNLYKPSAAVGDGSDVSVMNWPLIHTPQRPPHIEVHTTGCPSHTGAALPEPRQAAVRPGQAASHRIGTGRSGTETEEPTRDHGGRAACD